MSPESQMIQGTTPRTLQGGRVWWEHKWRAVGEEQDINSVTAGILGNW